jgi:DNA-binding MarR family transcriptional regulator
VGERVTSKGDAGDAYRLEEQAGHLLRRAHQRATAIFAANLGNGHQITPTQWAALVKLGDEGTLSQNHLGRLTAMDPATIQGVIRRLMERGLIERFADAGDRRRTVLQLSATGEALVSALLPKGHGVSAAVLEPLRPVERKQLLDLLKRLG